MRSTLSIAIACALSCATSAALAQAGVDQSNASAQPLLEVSGILALGLVVALTLRRKR